MTEVRFSKMKGRLHTQLAVDYTQTQPYKCDMSDTSNTYIVVPTQKDKREKFPKSIWFSCETVINIVFATVI